MCFKILKIFRKTLRLFPEQSTLGVGVAGRKSNSEIQVRSPGRKSVKTGLQKQLYATLLLISAQAKACTRHTTKAEV
jgi:hypothetical protein